MNVKRRTADAIKYVKILMVRSTVCAKMASCWRAMAEVVKVR